MLLLAMVVDLYVLTEVHTLLKIRSQASRVRDSMLVVLSDLALHLVLVYSGEVPLVNDLLEEAGLTLIIVDELATQALLLSLCDTLDQLSPLEVVHELYTSFMRALTLVYNFADFVPHLRCLIFGFASRRYAFGARPDRIQVSWQADLLL